MEKLKDGKMGEQGEMGEIIPNLSSLIPNPEAVSRL